LPDIVSPEVRSRMMAAVGPKNSKPEMILRRGLHALGYRYRLHDRKLPGRPDLVFPGRRAVILVNGCFWHGHDCHLFRWPGTRPEFWHDKIRANIRRDSATRTRLGELGWRVCEVWECQLKGRDRRPVDEVLAECAAFLDGNSGYHSIGSTSTVTTDVDA